MFNYLDRIFEGKNPLVKEREKAEVFKETFRNPGTSRKLIINALGFRPTGVSNCVNELIKQGLVNEGSVINDGKKGRPEKKLSACYNRFQLISIFVVSEHIKGVLFNLKQEIIAERVVEISSDIDNDFLQSKITYLIKYLLDCSFGEVIGIGFSLPGKVNGLRKVLNFAARWPKVKDFDFSFFEKKFHLPISVSSYLEAELIYLLTQDEKLRNKGTLIYHWGFGVGAKFANNGIVLDSESGSSMEIGHTLYDPNSNKKCRCGSIGCIETECAIWALLDSFPLKKGTVPKDEKKFEEFLSNLNEEEIEKLRHSISVAAYGLLVLFQIFYPNNIILKSPFLNDDRIFDIFKEEFYSKIVLGNDVPFKMVRIDSSVSGEIYGSTYSLILDRLYNEMVM